MSPITKENLFTSDDLVIDFFSDGTHAGKTVAFTFTPYEDSSDFWLNSTGYGGDLLLKSNLDVVAFKSTKNLWYQNLAHETLAAIARFIDGHPASHVRRVGYGSSMGAYAAIQFSRALKLDAVLAISPQFEIDKRYDRRWKHQARQIKFRHRIDKRSVSESCRYFIAYDPKTDDALHIDRFRPLVGQRQLVEIPVRFSGHPTTTYLAETGLLKDIALSVLQYGIVGDIDIFSRRKQSVHYLLGLSAYLAKRQKYRSALIAIDRAIALGANTAEFHIRRSEVLHGLGLHEQALVAQDNARQSIGDEAHLQIMLSHHLAKYGDTAAAIRLTESVLQRSPFNPQLTSHLAMLHIMHGGPVHWASAATYFMKTWLLHLKQYTSK